MWEIRNEVENAGKGLSKINKKRKYASLVNKVESQASKNGLEELKISGATKDELRDAKEFLKAKGETYRTNNAEWKKKPPTILENLGYGKRNNIN